MSNEITVGTHKARAIPSGVKWGISAAGNEQVSVPFTFLDTGNQMTWIGTFAPGKATDMALEALMAAGWDGEDLNALEKSIGSTDCELVVDWDAKQDGTRYLRVKFVNRSGGGFSFKKELDAGGRRALADRIKGTALAMKQRRGGAAGPAGAGDDLPF